MADKRRRPEQELAAADRRAEHDDAGADDSEPAELLRRGGTGNSALVHGSSPERASGATEDGSATEPAVTCISSLVKCVLVEKFVDEGSFYAEEIATSVLLSIR